jgi:fatty-acyl-CoA synthase
VTGSLTVQRMVEHAFARAGTRVISADGSTATMAELEPRVRALAAALAAEGVGPGEPVSTLLWNQQEHFEAYLAVPAMGAVLHTVNVRLGGDELGYVLEHAGSDVLIVDVSVLDIVAPVLEASDSVALVVVTGSAGRPLTAVGGRHAVSYEDFLADAPRPTPWPAVAEDAPAGMCYTSGTTGRPKGVVYSNRSTYLHAMSVCSGNAVGMSARDRALVLVPMFHANAWGWPYAAVASGADLVLPGGDLSARAILRLIERDRPTITGAVPTVLSDLLGVVGDAGRRPDLSSLRMVLCGGSAVPEQLARAYRDDHGVEVVPAWGMTEVSPLGSVAWPTYGVSTVPQGSTGRMVFDVEARIVDADGQELPRDGRSVGELEVRGPWVATRYHRDESPESFHDGWLRTGDVGTLDEHGYLVLTDRAKDVIKSGGEWISSVALENALAAQPGVREAAVVAIQDDRWGERPLAVVAARDPDLGSLRAGLAAAVPRWWLPDAWAVVDQVPRTSVGKYDKRLLRELHASGRLHVVTTAGAPIATTPE